MTRVLPALFALAAGLAAGAAGAAAEIHRIEAVAEPGAPAIWGAAEVVVRDADGEVVARRHAVPAKVDLPADGDYAVTVIYESAAGRAELAESGETRVNLSAGEVTLSLVERPGGPRIEEPQSWEVRYYRPGRGTGKLVARTEPGQYVLTLSEGWYEVATDRGGRTVTHTVQVEAGVRYDYTIVADAQ